MESFADREKKVIDFISSVKEFKDQEAKDNAFRNSEDYKLKCLNNNQDEAKGVCLDMLFSKIYKDALPLNDDYKVAHGDDLDAEMKDFINSRCPKGMAYYVHEGIKKGSKAAKKIMDETDKIVEDDYNKKAMNLENYDADELVFRSSDDTRKKIDAMSNDLDIDQVSSAIKDNVKASAISEIKRAKDAEKERKALEEELKNDMSVTTPEQVAEAVELRGLNTPRDFQPTLFQGIMIGKLDKFTKMQESGQLENEYIYNTLAEFGLPEPDGDEPHYATAQELAFIESVKEYTKLNIIKALKLERFDPVTISNMANEYAYMN